MREPENWRGIPGGWWVVLPTVAAVYLAAGLWLPLSGEPRMGPVCGPGDWNKTLATATDAASRGETAAALRCGYLAFLDADVAEAGAALVRVGDLLRSLGVQRYLNISVRSLYLRAADYARRTQEWPLLAVVATRLIEEGDLQGAHSHFAEFCSHTAAAGSGVPCNPVRLAATQTVSAEE